MTSYSEFIREHIIQSLISDQILTSGTQFYQHRKSELSTVKSGISVPSLAFSSEIGIIIEVISSELRKVPYQAADPRVTAEDVIAGKVLELAFFMVKKTWTNYQITLFPYLKSKNLISLIQR